MRRVLSVLFVLFVPLAVFAQEHPQAGDVAHGAEKQAHEQAHPTEEHGGEGEAPKTYFGIPAWILKLANMLLFIGALVYFVRKPLKSAMTERSAAIRRAAEEAKERRVKADQMAGEIQARLAAIENEVKAIHQRAEAEGEKQKRDLIAAAEAEAAKILQAACNEVDNRLKHARHELTEYAGELAAQRAEQLLRNTITEDDKSRLFQDSLKQVSEVRS
jgi:F0F1-type ATP synthase membrane subunit b/b'